MIATSAINGPWYGMAMKNRAALKPQQLFPEKLKTETLLEAQQA